ATRPGGAANGPRGSRPVRSRCCACWPEDCPTSRSPSDSSSPARPSTTTSSTSTRRSASPTERAPASSRCDTVSWRRSKMRSSPHDMTAANADHRVMLLTEFHGQAAAVVDESPAEVFAAITAIDRMPEWNERIASLTRPPVAPLAKDVEWTVQMSVPPAKWPSRSRVVAYDLDGMYFEHNSQSDDGNPT